MHIKKIGLLYYRLLVNAMENINGLYVHFDIYVGTFRCNS